MLKSVLFGNYFYTSILLCLHGLFNQNEYFVEYHYTFIRMNMCLDQVLKSTLFKARSFYEKENCRCL